MKLGESPEVFGARIGISGMTVRRIEEGKSLNLSTAFRIAVDMDEDLTDLWPPPTLNRSGAGR